MFFLQLNGAFHPLEKNSNIRNIPQNLNHWFMAEILPYWGCLGYLEYFLRFCWNLLRNSPICSSSFRFVFSGPKSSLFFVSGLGVANVCQSLSWTLWANCVPRFFPIFSDRKKLRSLNNPFLGGSGDQTMEIYGEFGRICPKNRSLFGLVFVFHNPWKRQWFQKRFMFFHVFWCFFGSHLRGIESKLFVLAR